MFVYASRAMKALESPAKLSSNVEPTQTVDTIHFAMKESANASQDINERQTQTFACLQDHVTELFVLKMRIVALIVIEESTSVIVLTDTKAMELMNANLCRHRAM